MGTKLIGHGAVCAGLLSIRKVRYRVQPLGRGRGAAILSWRLNMVSPPLPSQDLPRPCLFHHH